MSQQSRSDAIFAEAKRYIPGGVSSTNRVVNPNLVFTKAEGAYIYDVDGKRYIDYHAAFGPPVLGHAHPEVNDRVHQQLATMDLVGIGVSEIEVELAKKITQHIPSAERVLFANSGSEATYAALRLSRAVTGRRKIVKFQGCYHGWHDAILMNIISPADYLGGQHLISAGMHTGVTDDTIVIPFNDVEVLAQTIEHHADEIAGVILEPVPHNIGCVLPRPEFLQALRALTAEHGIVLIFDEVISGFRHGLGGYQKIVGITPDITTLGKAIANGYPLAAMCGRADLMERASPGGDVFFAGTYNAHPVGVSASLATIEILERSGTYEHLFRLGDRMRSGLQDIVDRLGLAATIAGYGSVYVLYFMEPPIQSYTDLLRNDVDQFVAYRRELIQRGVYELPVNLKRNHVSLAHTEADIDESLQVAEASLRQMLEMTV
jgi:glutamate-1-semialdehyde 2,1-aminomutase